MYILKGQTLTAVLLTSLITLSSASSHSNSTTPVIVVTPSSVDETREQSSIPLTVIDAQAIKNANVKNVAELLRGQAGLHVSDLFGDGSQSTVDIRGFGPAAVSNTLILVDGRRLNNSADTAAPDLSTIAIDDIEQIEILQGSAGVLYGNQAVGGVINIIRKKITRDETTVELGLGSFNSSRLNASLKRLIGQTRLSINASALNSDNYRDHNEADKNHLAIRAVRQHAGFSGYVEFQTTDDNIHTPGALLEPELNSSRTQSLDIYQDDYFDTQTDVFRTGLDVYLDATKKINVDLSRRKTDREFIQSFRSLAGSLSTQDRETDILTAKFVYTPDHGSQLKSLVSGVTVEQIDYDLTSALGPQKADQSIEDFYVSTEWKAGTDGNFQFGLRTSHLDADLINTEFDFVTLQNTAVAYQSDESVTLGSLGYTWQPDNWKVYTRIDQNFRYPTVEESTNLSMNQDFAVKPQQGYSFEMGAEYFAETSRYRATLYRINLEDEIAFDSTGFASLNLDKTQREGIILEASRHWTRQVSTNLSYTYLDAGITEGAFKGKDLPLVPEQSVRLDIFYEYSPQTQTSLELIAVGKQAFGGDFANELGKLPAYSVINAQVSHAIKSWDLSLRVNNLMDEAYSERGNQYTDYSNFPDVTLYQAFFPAPERNFWLKAKYEF